MRKPNRTSGAVPYQIVGWRERIGLPDLGIPILKAKIDTGARTTALHAVDLKTEMRGDEEWITFHVASSQLAKSQRSEAKIIDRRKIKNTSGIPQIRYIIRTTLILDSQKWPIEVSLADRENMTHDIILGRTAIRYHKLLVSPGKSYLAGYPQ